jgi:2-keto-4-pentenoate hydratase
MSDPMAGADRLTARASDPTSTPALVAAADRLWQAYASRKPCMPVRDLIGASDVALAYAVQDHNTARWLAQGRRLSGRKIGLTARSVQRQLGVDEPDYGMLFADMAVSDGEEVAVQALLQPRVEGEVAFCLKRDLSHPQLTLTDVLGAIDYVLAAIEIVDSRIDRWDIKIADTVADNASSGRYVLGNEKHSLGDVDLRLCGMVLERRGEQLSFGAGAACLGHPLNATLWLARRMVSAGRPLLAGDLVMSGALGPMVAAQPGDIFDLKINGLGTVRAAFARASSR